MGGDEHGLLPRYYALSALGAANPCAAPFRCRVGWEPGRGGSGSNITPFGPAAPPTWRAALPAGCSRKRWGRRTVRRRGVRGRTRAATQASVAVDDVRVHQRVELLLDLLLHLWRGVRVGGAGQHCGPAGGQDEPGDDGGDRADEGAQGVTPSAAARSCRGTMYASVTCGATPRSRSLPALGRLPRKPRAKAMLSRSAHPVSLPGSREW